MAEWITGGPRQFLNTAQMTNNARIVWDFCKTNFPTWSDAFISGLLGNIAVESSFNPGIFQYANNWAFGVGLNQWTSPSRPVQASTNPINTRGQALNIPQQQRLLGDNQLQIFLNEMTRVGQGGVWGQWFNIAGENINFNNAINMTDVNETTRQWLRGYYRAGVSVLSRRQQYARMFHNLFEGTGGNSQGGIQLAVIPVRRFDGRDPILTQGEQGSGWNANVRPPNPNASHWGHFAMDFAWAGRTNVPMFAPFDCRCVFTEGTSGIEIWESLGPVKWADGRVDFAHVLHVHSNNRLPLGTIRRKGEIYARTGVAGNVTGDHTHIQVAPGQWGGNPVFQQLVSPAGRTTWRLRNSTNLWKLFSICDNVSNERINIIRNPGVPNYPWVCVIDWVDGTPGNNRQTHGHLIPLESQNFMSTGILTRI